MCLCVVFFLFVPNVQPLPRTSPTIRHHRKQDMKVSLNFSPVFLTACLSPCPSFSTLLMLLCECSLHPEGRWLNKPPHRGPRRGPCGEDLASGLGLEVEKRGGWWDLVVITFSCKCLGRQNVQGWSRDFEHVVHYFQSCVLVIAAVLHIESSRGWSLSDLEVPFKTCWCRVLYKVATTWKCLWRECTATVGSIGAVVLTSSFCYHGNSGTHWCFQKNQDWSLNVCSCWELLPEAG